MTLTDTLARLFNHLEHNDDEVGAALAEKAIELCAWISVKDRLPTTCGDYLVTDGDSCGMYYFDLHWMKFNELDGPGNHSDVTHWMPLPQLPKQ